MNRFPTVLSERLNDLDRVACRRQLSPRSGVDFSSNDYLGFARDPIFKRRVSDIPSSVPVGATASRLLRGQLPIFEEVEKELAEFCGRESALLFPSGYQANVGLLSCLLRSGDVVFSDQFNHASMIDGIKLSGAERRVFPHRDTDALRLLLKKEPKDDHRLKVIVTESLFSMDGDAAPLIELAELAEEFSALLVVDEAHATGLWGDFENNRGGGMVQSLGLSSRVFATIHPAGKAMGVSGAWISGDSPLKEYLVNFSRSFIFSTAPSPFLASLIQSSVSFWKENGIERARLVLQKAKSFQEKVRAKVGRGVTIPSAVGPILPLIIGENDQALRIALVLQREGFDIRAIRPPTVPPGTARLRLSLNWYQEERDLENLSELLERWVKS